MGNLSEGENLLSQIEIEKYGLSNMLWQGFKKEFQKLKFE